MLLSLLALQPAALVVHVSAPRAHASLWHTVHAPHAPLRRPAAPAMMMDSDSLPSETAEAAAAALGQAVELSISPEVSGDVVVAGVYALLLLAALQLLRSLVPAALNLALALAALLALGGSASWYAALPPNVQPLVLPALVGIGVLVAGAVAVSRVQDAVDSTTTTVSHNQHSICAASNLDSALPAEPPAAQRVAATTAAAAAAHSE